MALAYPFVLALALSAFLRAVLRKPGDEETAAKASETYFLLVLFALSCLLWARNPGPGTGFPPPLTPGAALWLGLPCLVFGALSFASLGGSFAWFLLGLGGGALMSAAGFCAYRWLGLAEAVRRLGEPVIASGVRLLLPVGLTLSLALGSLALGHPDFAGRRLKYFLLILVLWTTPTAVMEGRLRSAWGYGPRDLASAAGLARASDASEVAIADLSAKEPTIGTRRQANVYLDLSPETSGRLLRYLREHEGRTIFAWEAAEALRRAALLWWDADLAVAAHCLSEGLVFPDYRQALALFRAGPLTDARFEKLRSLMSVGLSRKEGFESINQSQYIFEAFSNSFGRFGNNDLARFWLMKIDGLWPVYERRIEVSPVEVQREGEISGSLLLDDRPASDVKVGLFYLPSSTMTYRDGSNLCCSQYPDSNGNFRFAHLGAGNYHLALQADPALLRGRVRGSPGVLAIPEFSTRPAVRVGPISIERGLLLPP